MKKMFTLRGVSQCGKTSKVRGVAQWLLHTYPNAVLCDIDFIKTEIWGVIEIGRLKIGFNSAGDTEEIVQWADDLLRKYPDIDILINTCRTRGAGYQHIENTYNYANGWIGKYIDVQKFDPPTPSLIAQRDARIYEEIITWLIGVEK